MLVFALGIFTKVSPYKYTLIEINTLKWFAYKVAGVHVNLLKHAVEEKRKVMFVLFISILDR